MEQYQEHITPDATQATTPEELHPVAAAFGGDIGSALEKGGDEVANRIQSLSLHLARMNYYRGETQKADLVNQYKQGLQNQLVGDPSDPSAQVQYTPSSANNASWKGLTFTPGQSPSDTSPLNQPQDRPLGVYNWTGNMAHGAMDYVDQWHQQASSQILQQAKDLGLRNFASLKTQMDNAWTSERWGIVKHENEQINQAQIKTYQTGMQLDADNAVTKQDPISLSRTMDSINQQAASLATAQHLDPQVAQSMTELQTMKFQSQALNNSMTVSLKSTGGDPTQFQATLDRLHDDGKINDTVYTNAGDHLDKLAKGITAQNEIAVKTQMVNQRMNTMQLALQGKIDLNNPNTASQISSQDPELGTALSNYNLNKNSNIKNEDEAFADATDKVFSAGSKEQISQYMTNVLKESKISQDRLNILFGAAADRGKNLADLDGQSKASNPLQNMIDGGIKALMNWGKEQGHDAQTYTDFLGGVKSNPVNEAYNDAITNSIIRKNPAVASMSTPPNMIINKTNDIKYVFPKTNRKEDNGSSNDSDK